jgi:hypothetical protein
MVRAVGGNSYTGTYSIKYSVADPALLTADTWAEGELFTYNAIDWYKIDVTAGQDYYIWFDSNYGDGSNKSLEGRFELGYNENSYGGGNSWDSSLHITAPLNGTIYLNVRGWNWDRTGTYAIAYNTTGDRPD